MPEKPTIPVEITMKIDLDSDCTVWVQKVMNETNLSGRQIVNQIIRQIQRYENVTQITFKDGAQIVSTNAPPRRIRKTISFRARI